MKIAYACSHWMGFPGLELIQSQGMLAGLITPDAQNDVVQSMGRFANRTGVPLLVINKKRRRDTLEKWLRELRVDALFVVSFPWKIPEPVLGIPTLGCYNFHPGAVPDYRGIEPIFWTIKNGEAQTAVSVLRMDNGFDTGDVVLSASLPIHTDDTYGLLLNKLSVTTRNAMEAMLPGLRSNEIPDSVSQPQNIFPQRRRPNADELTVDWQDQTASQIRNLVRAANPAFGGAIVSLRGIPFRLLAVSIVHQTPEPGVMPGTVLRSDPVHGLYVACLDGVLKIDIISSQEGVFRGESFTALFGIGRGDLFS